MKTKSIKIIIQLFTLVTLITSVGQANDFYKCMSLNIGAENTTWTMFLLQSLPQGINSQMSVEDIVLASTAQKEIEKIVFDVAQQNIARFVQNSTSALMTKNNYNFNTEFTHSLR